MRPWHLAPLAVLISTAALAAPPEQLPVQGFLQDDAGAPLDGDVSLRVRLYGQATSGTALLDQTLDLTVDRGAFVALVPVDHELFLDNDVLFLGLAVDGAAEMTPRFTVATSPFASRAAYADDAATFAGLLPEDFRAASDPVPWADLLNVPADLLDGDDDTTYTAGDGLSLTGATFAVRQPTVEGWARGVAYDTPSELLAALNGAYIPVVACNDGEVLSYAAVGGWDCVDPATLPVNVAAVDAAVADNGYAAASDVSSLSSTVSGLQTSVSTAQSSITTLQGNVTTLQTGVSTLQSNVSSLQTAAPAIGSAPNLPGTSCLDIKTRYGEAPNGIYWVDPNGGTRADAFQVYCDMTTDGGGWTLVEQTAAVTVTGTNKHLCQAGAVGALDLTDATLTGPAKLANSTINAMWSSTKELLVKYDEEAAAGVAAWDRICKVDFKSTYQFNTTLSASSRASDLDSSTFTCFVGSMPAMDADYNASNSCGFGYYNVASSLYLIQGFTAAYSGGTCTTANAGRSWLGVGNYGCNAIKHFVR